MSDPRIRRSKRALRGAFIELIERGGMGDLTVDDVLKRAEISRGTFYAHYRDLGHLLDEIVDDVLVRFRVEAGETAPAAPIGFSGAAVRTVLEVVAEQPGLFRAVLRGEGDGRALQRLRTELAQVAEETMRRRAEEHRVNPRLPLDFVAHAWTGGLLTVVSWWLDHDMHHAPEDLARMLRDYSVHGRAWANGFDVGSDDEVPVPPVAPSGWS